MEAKRANESASHDGAVRRIEELLAREYPHRKEWEAMSAAALEEADKSFADATADAGAGKVPDPAMEKFCPAPDCKRRSREANHVDASFPDGECQCDYPYKYNCTERNIIMCNPRHGIPESLQAYWRSEEYHAALRLGRLEEAAGKMDKYESDYKEHKKLWDKFANMRRTLQTVWVPMRDAAIASAQAAFEKAKAGRPTGFHFESSVFNQAALHASELQKADEDFVKLCLSSISGVNLRGYARTVLDIGNAGVRLREAMAYSLAHKAKWLPAYDAITVWMAGNKGKGLALVGPCGTGKTCVAVAIHMVLKTVYPDKEITWKAAAEINGEVETRDDDGNTAKRLVSDVLSEADVMIIDDVGVEGERNHYGNKSWVFGDLVDIAERRGKLLIMTTNLDKKRLREKYGDRTWDRLGPMMVWVPMGGESMRETWWASGAFPGRDGSK